MTTRDLAPPTGQQWTALPTDSTDSFNRSDNIMPWIIPVEDIVILRNTPLSSNGSVYRGTWKNAVVAVRALSPGVSMEVIPIT